MPPFAFIKDAICFSLLRLTNPALIFLAAFNFKADKT
jgi:hypothetical protein